MTETDAEFVERMARDAYMIGTDEHDADRLFALARRVAAADAEIDRLRAALREIAKTTYGYEPCMTYEEAAEYFKSRFFGAQSIARAALGEKA